MAYADVADLEADVPDGLEVPSDAARKLRRASELLDAEVLTQCVYDVDDDGLPTDERVADVLRRATLEQAWWWVETGDDSGAGSVVSGSTGGPTVTGRLPRLAPQAVAVLRSAVDSTGAPLLVGLWSV